MATHSECVTGGPLERYDTACTAAVCGLDPNCCSSRWTSKCTTAANATCTAGLEEAGIGFCGIPL